MTGPLLEIIVKDPLLHARWLNTLSMMENTGAKKIKRCEHPIFVTEEILKHASEESRHAWLLKKQLKKIGEGFCPTYEFAFLLAAKESYGYLHQLDIDISRYLKQRHQLRNERLKYAAYLLVTYAIEIRADELYPQYQLALKQSRSKVTVQTIISEEKNHLEEMQKQLKEFSPAWQELCFDACCAEALLYEQWVKGIEKEIKEFTS